MKRVAIFLNNKKKWQIVRKRNKKNIKRVFDKSI